MNSNTSQSSLGQPFPTLQTIRETRDRLRPLIRETPIWKWERNLLPKEAAAKGEVFLKLELFQKTGTFKVRGALNSLVHLTLDELKRGVTTFSGGNHAIAVAYAAQVFGTSAKVVMPRSANPARRSLAAQYGAEVILVPDVHAAFEKVKDIEVQEKRVFIHPFEGPWISNATGTIGLELMEQIPNLDAVVVPIGGGGLCSGISAAVKQINPLCEIFGVEPEGASSMQLSFTHGEPMKLAHVNTIADSLGPPSSAHYSFELCQKYVSEIVIVKDAELIEAMKILFSEMKLAVESAAAASTAALLGPLRERLKNKRVALLICGSNIDASSYCKLLETIKPL